MLMIDQEVLLQQQRTHSETGGIESDVVVVHSKRGNRSDMMVGCVGVSRGSQV